MYTHGLHYHQYDIKYGIYCSVLLHVTMMMLIVAVEYFDFNIFSDGANEDRQRIEIIELDFIPDDYQISDKLFNKPMGNEYSDSQISSEPVVNNNQLQDNEIASKKTPVFKPDIPAQENKPQENKPQENKQVEPPDNLVNITPVFKPSIIVREHQRDKAQNQQQIADEQIVNKANKPEETESNNEDNGQKLDEILSRLESEEQSREQDSQQSYSLNEDLQRVLNNLDNQERESDLMRNRENIMGNAQHNNAVHISQLISAQIKPCWVDVPLSAQSVQNIIVKIDVDFLPDGHISQIIIVDGNRYRREPIFRAVADSARKALLACSPLDLPENLYADWQRERIEFDTSNLEFVYE